MSEHVLSECAAAPEGVRGNSILTVQRSLPWLAAAVLGAALLVPRIGAIHQSLWNDEIVTFQRYVSRGPAAIFGHYGTNDHMLFSLLAWLSVWLLHGPDWLSRMWAIVPFLAGVVGVAIWLRLRAGLLVAGLFAAFAATSAQLLFLTSEARGYGLAFMFMALLVVSAHEGAAKRSSRWLGAFSVACVLGTWTLPTFLLPAAGAAAALIATRREIRRILVPRLVFAAVAIGVWYAPSLGGLLDATGQHFGAPLPWDAPLTGGASLFADAFLPGIVGFSAIVRLAACAAVAPLLIVGIRQASKRIPLFMAPAVAAISLTLTVLTLSRMWVDDRFLSFLLVQVLVVAAFGAALLVRHLENPIVFVYAALIVILGSSVFALAAADTIGRPYEDMRGAARAVSVAAHGGIPVIVNMHKPGDLLFYLPAGTRLRVVPQPDLERELCQSHPHGLVFVQQPFYVEPAKTTCLVTQGATLHRFLQRGRGGSISVWVVRPERRNHQTVGHGVTG